MLEKGAAVDSKDEEGRTPLCYAAQYAYKIIVEPFVRNGGADLSVTEKSAHAPLALVAKSGHRGVVKYLLEWSAQRDYSLWSFEESAEWDYSGLMKILIEYGADPDMKECEGCKALTWLVEE